MCDDFVNLGRAMCETCYRLHCTKYANERLRSKRLIYLARNNRASRRLGNSRDRRHLGGALAH